MLLPNLFISAYKQPAKKTAEVAAENRASNLSKFRRPPPAVAPIVGLPGDYQADLMFMPESFAKFNEGQTTILNLIHVNSRFLYSFLMKAKSAAADDLMHIIPQLDPPMQQLRIDAGNEFLNKKLSDFLASRDITVKAVNKAKGDAGYSLGIVERVNKTVRDLIYRYLDWADQHGADKYRYKPVFSDLIAQYNNSPNSSLPVVVLPKKGHSVKDLANMQREHISPAKALDVIRNPLKDVNNVVIYRVMQQQQTAYLKEAQQMKDKIKANFPIGSKVRILNPRARFQKSSQQTFSDNLYKVLGYKSYSLQLEGPDGTRISKLYHEVTPATGKAVEIKRESSEELKQMAKELNISRREKAEDIKAENILTGKRNRRPNSKYQQD
jgi:hypothetical protein